MVVNLMEVDKWIREFKYQHDLTNIEIAEATGFGLSTVNHWMWKNTFPRPRAFQHLLDVYGYKMVINGKEVRWETYKEWLMNELEERNIRAYEFSLDCGYGLNYIASTKRLEGYSFCAMQSFTNGLGYQIEIVKKG